MKKCITCGQEIKDDALFCPYCGTRNQGDEQGAATAQDTVQDTSVNDNQAEDSSDDTVTTDEAAQNIANDPFAYNTSRNSRYRRCSRCISLSMALPIQHGRILMTSLCQLGAG